MSPREIESTSLPPRGEGRPGPGQVSAWGAEFTTIRVTPRLDGIAGRRLTVTGPGVAAACSMSLDAETAGFLATLLTEDLALSVSLGADDGSATRTPEDLGADFAADLDRLTRERAVWADTPLLSPKASAMLAALRAADGATVRPSAARPSALARLARRLWRLRRVLAGLGLGRRP